MGYRILIVDDSAGARMYAEDVIRASTVDECRILHADSGSKALEILDQEWVDLVISDLHMDSIDGAELIARIRERDEWSDLPVLIVTSEACEETRRGLVELGAAAVWNKPIEPARFGSMVMKILNEKC